MQYADVAVAIKSATRQPSYTYKISPRLLTDIKVGQRVFVPFAGRRLIGTIINLRTQPPKIRGQLKEIERLVDPFPLFKSADLELARVVAQTYAATIGQVLEIAAPKPAIRTAKNYIVKTPYPATVTSKLPAKPRDRQVYGIYQPLRTRLMQYISLIKRASSTKRSVIVLFPSLEQVQQFAKLLIEHQVNHTQMPLTSQLSENYQIWLASATDTISVLIGTRKTIFVPMPSLGLIIIDSPSEYGYKEEQFPYYHAATVAKLRAEISSSHLVLGDVAPTLLDWRSMQLKKLQLISKQTRFPDVTLYDTTANRGLISDALVERINITLQAGQKVALYYNRIGSGKFYRCLECESAIYCPHCDTMLTVFGEDPVTLRCGHCSYETAPPYRCLRCTSYRLGSVGLGVDSLAKLIKNHFPAVTIATLGGKEKSSPTSYDILITTAKLFYLPSNHYFGTLAVFHVDQLLHGPAWDTSERAYLTLCRLAERTDQLILHTSLIDNPVIRAVTTGERDELYAKELENRTIHRYPPVSPVMRLTFAHADVAVAQGRAEALYQIYLKLLPDPENQLFPPSPVGSGKRRGKYRYQIIIKSGLSNIILDNLPTDWQIDPEPTDL